MGYACSKTMPNSCRAVANSEVATEDYPEGLTSDEYYTEELPEWVEVPETYAQILARQSAVLASLTQECNLQKAALTVRIGVIQDAIDAKDDPDAQEFWATPEEEAELPLRKSQLTKWKQYGILLGRVTSQEGWPPEPVWPTKPTAGMDLSISSVAPSPAPSQ